MKKNILPKTVIISFFLVCFFNNSFSQIDPGNHIYIIDSCDFESPCNMMVLDTSITGNIWQIGSTIKPFFDSAHSPVKAIMTDTINVYPSKNQSCFDLYISTICPFNPLITFWHKYQTDSLKDGGYIEVSHDNGITWKNVVYDTSCFSYNGGTPNRENFYTASDTISGGIPAFSGTSNGWVLSKIQWIWWIPIMKSNYFSPGDTMIVRFHFSSDSIQTNKAGWIIDDLTLYNVDFPGGINETPSVNKDILVSPNPLSDACVFRCLAKSDLISSLEVIDVMGRSVFSQNKILVPELKLSRNSLPTGIYFYTISLNNHQRVSGKLIMK